MLNSKNSATTMATMIETMEHSFDFLNPYEKARFIDERLAWATGGALCTEVQKRICAPMSDE